MNLTIFNGLVDRHAFEISKLDAGFSYNAKNYISKTDVIKKICVSDK